MMVFVCDMELSRARERIKKNTFLPAMERLRTSVNNRIEGITGVPEKRAGHFHHYFCQEHGVQLDFDPRSPAHHWCSAGDHGVKGAEVDAAWLWFVNDRLSNTAMESALLGALTFNDEDRDRALNILCNYADNYPRLPGERGFGRATHQLLDEAIWIIRLIWTYAWIQQHNKMDSTIHNQIRNQLLIPACEYIIRNMPQAIHNMVCWYNTAILTGGVLLGIDEWVEKSLRGNAGLIAQLDKGFGWDGLWFEGSPSYHFYTGWALLWSARVNEEVRYHRNLRTLVRTPLEISLPDLSLPAFNDCWYHSSLVDELVHGTPRAENYYELLYAWHRTPESLWLLSEIYKQRPRDSVEALLFGHHKLPESSWRPTLDSHVASSAGIGVLRNNDRSQIMMKYGPHGGIHGHPDKLGLSVSFFGRRFSVDLGTAGYGDMSGMAWYRSTIAHNTVIVDGVTQPKAEGKLLQFREWEDQPFGILEAEVAWEFGKYGGVRMRRLLILSSGYLIDVFFVDSKKDHKFELSQRIAGDVGFPSNRAQTPDESFASPGSGEYENLHETRRIEGSGSLRFQSRLDDSGMAFFVAESSEVLVSEVPSNPRHSTEMLVLRRVRGNFVRFVAVFEPCKNDSQFEIESTRVIQSSGQVLQLEILFCSGKRDLWTFEGTGPTVVKQQEIQGEQTRKFSHQPKPITSYTLVDKNSTYIGQYARGLMRRGVSCSPPTSLSEKWLGENQGEGRVLHFHWPSYHYGSADLETSKRLLTSYILTLKQARALGYGIVWTVHNLYPHENVHHELNHLARRELVSLCTGIIAHCDHAASVVRRLFQPSVPVTVIPHGNYCDEYAMVDKKEARRLLGLPGSPFVYLCFGEIREYKDMDSLVKLFAKPVFSDSLLVLAGRVWKDMADHVKSLVKGKDNILLRPGFVADADVPLFFGASDAVITAYSAILTSGVVVLAQSLGKLVIAPELGCIPEMAPEGTRLLYAKKSGEELEEAMLACREIADTAGQGAFNHAQSLSWSTIAKKTELLYRDATERAAVSTGDYKQYLSDTSTQDGTHRKEPAEAKRIREFFTRVLPKRVAAASIKALKGVVCQFNITDLGEIWVIDLSSVKPRIEIGENPEGLTISLCAVDCLAVLEGRMTPQTAIMSGVLTLSGQDSEFSSILPLLPLLRL